MASVASAGTQEAS